jgi:hypothetical protein
MSGVPPYSLSVLAGLDRAALDRMFGDGTCPALADLDGVLDGRVLNGALDGSLLRHLRLWRGKVFTHDGPTVTGMNRVGVGPVGARRYRFTARVERSLFDDRDVVLLDHDQPSNPGWVRRFHDELVQVEDGLYLARSHYRGDDGLRFLCHFGLTG